MSALDITEAEAAREQYEDDGRAKVGVCDVCTEEHEDLVECWLSGYVLACRDCRSWE